MVPFDANLAAGSVSSPEVFRHTATNSFGRAPLLRVWPALLPGSAITAAYFVSEGAGHFFWLWVPSTTVRHSPEPDLKRKDLLAARTAAWRMDLRSLCESQTTMRADGNAGSDAPCSWPDSLPARQPEGAGSLCCRADGQHDFPFGFAVECLRSWSRCCFSACCSAERAQERHSPLVWSCLSVVGFLTWSTTGGTVIDRLARVQSETKAELPGECV